uniref:Protein-glucosylgalactosylhydroxylysine glucosidase n=1 Tax=Schistocephalus solidus TaxID=70667 RepID=A0A183SW52_SCHSO
LLEPCLSNGYIGMDPSTPWLFVDGIYSGEGTESHRAAVPSPVFWKPVVDTLPCLESTMMFHFGMGVSLTVQHYPGLELQTSTFVSRARPNIMVRVLEALFLNEDEEDATRLKKEVLIRPDRPVDFESPDFETSVDVVNGHLVRFHGRIWQRENDQCLPECDQVFMLTGITPDLATVGIRLTRTNPRICLLTSVSRFSWDEAVEAYEAALNAEVNSPDTLLTETAEAWLNVWRCGRILLETTVIRDSAQGDSAWEVLYNSEKGDVRSCSLGSPTGDGNVGSFSLKRCIIAAQYFLLANFPDPSKQPTGLPMPSAEGSTICSFFGVSPAGLARGNTEDDYQGHVFWDMDTWMLPWMILFHPERARIAFEYRAATLFCAEARAAAEGFRGARYPWESARTGFETSPWDLSANKEIHVVAGISLALQQWLLCGAGGQAAAAHYEFGRRILDSIGRFWTSRLSYSEEKQSYVIEDVMPPDEYVSACNNSAYTNAVVAIALSGPAKLARLFEASVSPEEDLWEQLSSQIWMPVDQKNQVMLEHEDYKDGTVVKQADAILLSYPLMFPQTREMKENLIRKYAAVTTMSGPAMTWTAFCTAALELGKIEEAADYLKRSLLTCQLPFYVWTEERDKKGARHFLTGLGGFLQSLVNGYAGLRVCMVHLVDSLDEGTSESAASASLHQAILLAPRTPVPTLTSTDSTADGGSNILHLRGLSFLNRRLDFLIDGVARNLLVALISGEPLRLTEAEAPATVSMWDCVVDPTRSPCHTIDEGQELSLPFAAYWLHE